MDGDLLLFQEDLINGRIEILREYLTDVHANILLPNNKKPIQIACENGNVDIVRLLIEKKCDINCSNNKKNQPIHFACIKGNLDIVELLIENKCDIECENINKKRPIHFACMNNQIDVVRLLIMNNCDVEREDVHNNRAVHIAFSYGYFDIVELLIERGCNVESEDRNKNRLIHHACMTNKTFLVKLLIDKGCNIECKNENSYRPIHIASENGYLNIVILLMENNCKLECLTNKKQTPLNLAKKNDHLGCVELLNQFVNIYNCIKGNKVKKFIKLYQRQIETGKENEIGISFLDLAREHKADKIVKYLMNKHVDDAELIYLTTVVNKKQDSLLRENILIRCIRDRHAEGFRQFCSATVINGQHLLLNEISNSFLEYAAKTGCHAFINEIMKKTLYDETVWDQAKVAANQKGYGKIAEDITHRESMIVSRLKTNFSLLHTAVNDNDVDMVQYILENTIIDVNINHDTFGTALVFAHLLHLEECIAVLERFCNKPNSQIKIVQTQSQENVMDNCSGFSTPPPDQGADSIQYTDNIDFLSCDKRDLMDHVNKSLKISLTENVLSISLKLNQRFYQCFHQILDKTNSRYSDVSKHSLLHLAGLSLQPDICRSLIEAGANVDEMNEEGNTCLLELMSNIDETMIDNIDGVIEIANLLIESGANINRKTHTGKSVFDCALRFGCQKLILSLIQKYADSGKCDGLCLQNCESLEDPLSSRTLKNFITEELIMKFLTNSEWELTKYLFDHANDDVQESVWSELILYSVKNEKESFFDYLLKKEICERELGRNGDFILTNIIKKKLITFGLKIMKKIPSSVCLPSALEASREMKMMDVEDNFFHESDRNIENHADSFTLLSIFQMMEIAHNIQPTHDSKCNQECFWNSLPFVYLRKCERIGAGSYGEVFRVLEPNTNQQFACKMFRRETDSKAAKYIERNITKYRESVRHTNIVRYFGAIERRENLYLIMEFMDGGSLKAYMKKYPRLPHEMVVKFTRDILKGLSFLHNKKIIHRDIKPDNILLDKNGNLKLTDFGLSRSLKKSEQCATFQGTLPFMAPEIRREMKYSFAADIWSVGATVVCMLKDEPLPILLKIGYDDTLDLNPIEPLSEDWRLILEKMLCRDPLNRLSADQLLNEEVLLIPQS